MSKPRIAAMLVLFTAAAGIEAVRLSSLSALSNSDVWWHLSSGLWILQHHRLPHTGLFTQSSSLPWIAVSWGYDVLLAGAYKLLALRAIPALLMCFKAGLAVLTFVLAGGLRGKFWPAILLSVAVQYILGSTPPGPIYFSILCLGTEFLLLLKSRTTGSKSLIWLPALFLAWANLDVHFVYGIVLLVIFLGALAIVRTWRNDRPDAVSFRIASGAVVLSICATLITPYFYHPYSVFLTSSSSAANSYFPDFCSMSFHQPQDYALLLLTMTAFLALGMRRSRDLFLIGALVACAIFSFHSQRDVWVVTLASLAIIAMAIPEREMTAGDHLGSWQAWATAVAVLVVLIGAFALVPRHRDALLAKIGESYPVEASAYIREHRLAQPMFNNYEWGGFLDWYLPEYPAAIDGRAELYGGDFLIEYFSAMNADIPYSEFPAMRQAQTLLLPANSLMGQALRNVPGFQVAYNDKVAVVLTKGQTTNEQRSAVQTDKDYEAHVKP
jgi:hypothetical protein